MTWPTHNYFYYDALNRPKHAFGGLNKNLIVFGCLSAINKKRLNSLFDGSVIESGKLEEIDELFPNFKVKLRSIKDGNFVSKNYNNKNGFLKTFFSDKIWLALKVLLKRHGQT